VPVRNSDSIGAETRSFDSGAGALPSLKTSMATPTTAPGITPDAGAAAIVTRRRGAFSIIASGVLAMIDSAPNDDGVRLFGGAPLPGSLCRNSSSRISAFRSNSSSIAF